MDPQRATRALGSRATGDPRQITTLPQRAVELAVGGELEDGRGREGETEPPTFSEKRRWEGRGGRKAERASLSLSLSNVLPRPPTPTPTHRCQTASAKKLVCKHTPTSGKVPSSALAWLPLLGLGAGSRAVPEAGWGMGALGAGRGDEQRGRRRSGAARDGGGDSTFRASPGCSLKQLGSGPPRALPTSCTLLATHPPQSG